MTAADPALIIEPRNTAGSLENVGLLALHDALGLTRGVMVLASVHGTDNRAMPDAAAAHPERLRAIVAVTEGVTEAEIAAVHAKGARGIRVNLVDRGGMPFRSLDDPALRIECGIAGAC